MDRKFTLIVGLLLLGVIVFGVDIWANITYPTEDFQIMTPLQIEGLSGTWEYYKDNIVVGTYSYSIGINEEFYYQITSITDVTYQGNSLLLESDFLFNDFLIPKNYNLTALQENEKTSIKTTFEEHQVVTVVDFKGEKTILEEPITGKTFLVDKTMPGHWEILLSSSNIQRGKKYDVPIFVPQVNSNIFARVLVEKQTKQIRIDESFLDCVVVKIDSFELSLFFFEGKLVRYQDDNENLVLNKRLDTQ